MKAKFRLLLGPALVPVLVTLFLFGGQTPTATPSSAIKGKIIQRELSFELGKAKRPKWAQKVSSGTMYNMLMAAGLLRDATFRQLNRDWLVDYVLASRAA